MDSLTQARLDDGKRCLDAALAYRELGISVIPLCPHDHLSVRHINKNHGRNCTSPGKTPLIVWKPFMGRIATEKEVIGWWELCPFANVGAAMGEASMLVRADVEGASGLQMLQDRSGGDLPDTWSFLSGREGGGGLGLLYRIPEGVQLRTTFEQPAPGEEFRLQARGAQTVLPPSRHVSGRLYEWKPGLSPFESSAALLPSWAIAMLSVQTPFSRPGAAGEKRGRSDDEWNEIYAGVVEPGRHSAAIAYAGRLIASVHDLGNRGALTAIWTGFAAWNERNEPPLPEEEAKRIFQDLVKKDRDRRKRETPDTLSLLFQRGIGPEQVSVPPAEAVNGEERASESTNGQPPEPSTNGHTATPDFHLIIWEGGDDNMEYWLRTPLWSGQPKLASSGGYVRLEPEEICFWPKIIKAVFVQANYRLLDRIKDWPENLNKMMSYAEIRKKPVEAWRYHQIDTFVLDELGQFHQVRLDQNGEERYGIGEPQQLQDGRIAVKLGFLVTRGAQRVEKFTRNEIMACLEHRLGADQVQLGSKTARSRFWAIDPTKLADWGAKLSTVTEEVVVSAASN